MMDRIQFNDNDLKEIFAVFASCTKHELRQVYDPNNYLYFEKENLMEEYELHEDKREYSLDALRAVLNWLQQHGYALEKDGRIDNLSWVPELFISD